MGKTYDQAPTEVHDRIAALMARFYFDTLKLAGLRIDVLMASTDTEGGHAVTLGGYPCQAVVKILGPKERAMDRGDAEIVIDRDNYEALDPAERDALLDHELYHLELQLDKHGKVKLDDHRRPKLKMRKHDFNVGWFHEIARRHKTASFEVKQATAFVAEQGQLYFGFAGDEAAALAARASVAGFTSVLRTPGVESVTLSSPGSGSVRIDKSGVSYEPDTHQIAMAKSVAEEEGYATVSMIQRKLSVGYNQASAIVSRLVAELFLCPPNDVGRYEIVKAPAEPAA